MTSEYTYRIWPRFKASYLVEYKYGSNHWAIAKDPTAVGLSSLHLEFETAEDAERYIDEQLNIERESLQRRAEKKAWELMNPKRIYP